MSFFNRIYYIYFLLKTENSVHTSRWIVNFSAAFSINCDDCLQMLSSFYVRKTLYKKKQGKLPIKQRQAVTQKWDKLADREIIKEANTKIVKLMVSIL